MYPKNRMYLLAAVAFAICCAAPLLVGAVLATGITAGLAAAGWRELALAVVATGIAGIWWSRRTRGRRGSRPSAQEVRRHD